MKKTSTETVEFTMTQNENEGKITSIGYLKSSVKRITNTNVLTKDYQTQTFYRKNIKHKRCHNENQTQKLKNNKHKSCNRRISKTKVSCSQQVSNTKVVTKESNTKAVTKYYQKQKL